MTMARGRARAVAGSSGRAGVTIVESIDRNGARPVPVAMNTCVRRSSGRRVKRPFALSDPDASPDRERPQPRREGAVRDEADQELQLPPRAGRRRGRVRALEQAAVDGQAKGEVLAGLERRDAPHRVGS